MFISLLQIGKLFFVEPKSFLQTFVLLDDDNFFLLVAINEVFEAVGVDFGSQSRRPNDDGFAVCRRNLAFVLHFADDVGDSVCDCRNFVVGEFGID